MRGRRYRHRTMIREMKDVAYEPIRSVTVVDFGAFA